MDCDLAQMQIVWELICSTSIHYNKIIIVLFWQANQSSSPWLCNFPRLSFTPGMDDVRKLSWKLLETGHLEIVSNLFLLKKIIFFFSQI